jgi:radical SAM superfamily enzyme YgiQ (UPF0313 family)
MNVLLLNGNYVRCARSGYPMTPAPTGLIFIGGYLRKHGHKVRIHQLISHVADQDEDDLPLLRAELDPIVEEFNPDAIGISVRNVGAARRARNPFHLIEYYSTFYDARVVRVLRDMSSAPIIIGGTGFACEPGLYLKHVKPDYGVIGEGEETTAALLDAIGRGEEPAGIPGVCRVPADAEEAVANCPRIADLGTLGVGACDVVADFREHYYDEGGYAAIQTKRGCAMRCIYCTTPFFEGREYRLRPVAHAIEEIAAYKEHWGVRHFFLVDATFNHPYDQALEVCDAILQAGLDIEWFAEISPASFDDELCRAMVQAGCIGVTLSPDSCSDSVLEAYDKPFGTAEIRNAVDVLRRSELAFDTRLIIGGPGETKETVAESMAFCAEHLRHEVVGFYDGMVITTRAPVFRIAAEEGVIDGDRPYEDVIFGNDFRAMKGYEYFFPHLAETRRELGNYIQSLAVGEKWRITSRDYAPDPATGEFAFRPEVSVEKGARPWWTGWTRRATAGPAQPQPSLEADRPATSGGA